MDKVLIRIAILIAIAFMASMIGGVAWILFGDLESDIERIQCPKCGIEFKMEIQ